MALCVLAGLLYAFMLYFREKRLADHATWKQFLLAFLRFSSVTGIAFMLLGPLLKINNDEVKNPVVVLVQDASSSVGKDLDNVQLMKGLQSQLSADYQLDKYHFSSIISEGITDSLDGNTTNLSQVFSFIDETYANQNLGAIVISTDGIFNEGQNPVYQRTNITAPVFFVAQGDTSLRKDIQIKQLYHNKIAYLGDKFIVQVDVSANNFRNTTTEISVSKVTGGNKQLIDRQAVQINSDNYFSTYSFEVPADQVGVVKYIVETKARGGEFSTRNNARSFYVDILDARQKILLYANGPHPDIAAIRNIVNTNKNYEVETIFAKKGVQNIQQYDFVLFHNLPSVEHGIQTELEAINRTNKPRMFVAGAEISIPAFNKAQGVLTIRANTKSTNTVQAELVSGFKLFEQSEELKKGVRTYPPMQSMFGEYTPDPNSEVLLKQKIGDVVTDYPLLAIKNQAGRREAVLAGEGIWQWRLYNYLQNNHFNEVNELLTKTIQYLSIKEDKRKFRVSTANNIYKSYDRILFDAELYNDSYEKINDSDAFLSIKDENGKEFPYTFSKIANYYQIDAGSFPAGNYRFTGNTNYNGKTLTATGKFNVQEVKLEQSNTTADHNLLRNLSEKYNGEVLYGQSANDIVKKLQDRNTLKPVIYSSIKTESALNLKWILFALIGLLILEWFVRRLLGTY